jgi:hypothetical protein
MARLIFIFPIILVYFLTIVSKSALGGNFTNHNFKTKTLPGKDTIISIFKDDFESGDLLGWKQTNDWEVSSVEKISGNFTLRHLPKTNSGSSSIFHAIAADWNLSNLEWTFRLKDGKWDPSSSNRFWFYLSADTITPELISGFAVGVNISGSTDLLSLWRIRNGKADSLIVASDLDWNASTLASISVKRTTQGNWTLTYQKSVDLNSKSFSGTDPTIFTFKNIGIYFKFTTTRSGQLWCDDITLNRLTPELAIQKLSLINSNLITITFNFPINPSSIHSGNFKLTDENSQNIPINQAIPTTGSNKSIDVSFGKTSGMELNLSVSGISDLSGKMMNPDVRSFSYSFPPEPGSILINEVLFNPFSGGVDFVELVNVSEHSIAAFRLMLSTRNDSLALKQIYAVGTEKRYLKPGQYLCCTKDPGIVALQYISNNSETFCQLKSFPSYSDDKGTVVLLNDSLEVLDEFSYSAKMHSPFLADEDGVSLERISLEKPTADCDNWASASASVGYATPGMPNSQTKSETEIQDEITSDPQAFSPNGDGYNDELTIHFKLNKPGYIANARIFDAAGRQVKFLVKNQSLAQEGNWLWNGKSESGQKLNIGVYIILVKVFDQAGNTKVFKKTCTITDRLE